MAGRAAVAPRSASATPCAPPRWCSCGRPSGCAAEWRRACPTAVGSSGRSAGGCSVPTGCPPRSPRSDCSPSPRWSSPSAWWGADVVTMPWWPARSSRWRRWSAPWSRCRVCRSTSSGSRRTRPAGCGRSAPSSRRTSSSRGCGWAGSATGAMRCSTVAVFGGIALVAAVPTSNERLSPQQYLTPLRGGGATAARRRRRSGGARHDLHRHGGAAVPRPVQRHDRRRARSSGRRRPRARRLHRRPVRHVPATGRRRGGHDGAGAHRSLCDRRSRRLRARGPDVRGTAADRPGRAHRRPVRLTGQSRRTQRVKR